MTWDERAKVVFAQGCNTFSKRSDQYIEGVSPTHCTGQTKYGEPGFYGADGKFYYDMSCGLGSNFRSFRNNFSIPTIHEVILAEKLKEKFPCLEKMKFLKTGSAACDAAIRFARAHTGKQRVLGVGYHGTSDWAISAEFPGVGTLGANQCYKKKPSLDSLIIALNDYGVEFCADWNFIAAVIIEPVQLDMNVRSQLEEIRRLCTEKGIVLIFDEVITGGRFLDYSVANHFGIQPDLICLGKAIADGYPLAVMGGRADILENEAFISNTHNGEMESILAAIETMEWLDKDEIETMWGYGSRFLSCFNGLCPKVQIIGYPARGELWGDELTKALFMQEAAKRGYNVGRAWFAHPWWTDEQYAHALICFTQIFMDIEAGKVTLEGQMPRPVFKRN